MLDHLSGMAVFATVVEAASFTEAARRLGLSKAAVSKTVARLEERLGARLLNRTTRRLALTEVGSAFFESCQRILTEAEEAERQVGQLNAQPRGTLRVNAPMSFGVTHLAPLLADFLGPHPDLSVDLTLNDRFVDLVEEGFDVAVRIGELADSSLIARRLATSRRVLVAAPSYLAARRRPLSLDDLKDHELLGYSYQQSGDSWRFAGPNGPRMVPLRPRVRANNGDALRQAAIGGLGIALLPTFIVAGDCGAGTLVELAVDADLSDIAIYAVYPHSRHLSAKVRAFIDYLALRFSPVPPWEAP
jgi:DNA-binding transcriptional LysR family regulator